MSAAIVDWVRSLDWVTQRQAEKFAASLRAEKLTLDDLANISTKRRKRLVTFLDVKPDEANKRAEFYKHIDSLKHDAENRKPGNKGGKSGHKQGGGDAKKSNKHTRFDDESEEEDDDDDEDEEDEYTDADDEDEESEEDDESGDDDEDTKRRKDDKKKDKKNNSSSSDDGRESDNEYEMEFEDISDILKEACSKPVAEQKEKEWKPVGYWLRSSGKEERGASYVREKLPKKMAGSIHKIALYCIKDSKGNLCRRLVKIARDPKEDNENHFREEYDAHQKMVPVAQEINKCFRITRCDMVVWPADLVRIEFEGKEHWALAQAPFIAPERNLFCKVEPNHGDKNDNDRMVARYQHAFAALTRGLYLIRDWQGFLVPYSVYEEQCRINKTVALEQIRERRNRVGTEIFVCIDPVLSSYDAHFIFENSTNFGFEAMDEWWDHHDCEQARCSFYKLKDEIQFGLADTDQEFFTEKSDKVEAAMQRIAEKLGIWTGEPGE